MAVPLLAGSCIFYHGHTLHYSRGNSTPFDRRVLMATYRPKTMVDRCRELGIDHGRHDLSSLSPGKRVVQRHHLATAEDSFASKASM